MRARVTWCAAALLLAATACKKAQDQVGGGGAEMGAVPPEGPAATPVPEAGVKPAPTPEIKPAPPTATPGKPPAPSGGGDAPAPTPVVTPTTTPAKPMPPRAGMANIIFKTTPPGAHVRLLAKDGTVVGEVTSPNPMQVQAGTYVWEVDLTGYLPDKSGTERVVLSAGKTDTVSVALNPIGDVKTVRDRADKAFATRGGCSEAVRLYESIPKPAEMNSALGTDWVTGQMRVAQCSMELREWNKALDALSVVKGARPREWTASYMEGQVYCQMGQYEKGSTTLRDLKGSNLGSLSTGARQAASLLSTYGVATCDRLEYEASGQPERNKDQLELFLGEYEEFISGAEKLQARPGFPADYARELTNALKSAKDNFAKHSKS
jgi:hypothetical protein